MKKKRILLITLCMITLLSSFAVCAKTGSKYYKRSRYCTAQAYGELSYYSNKKDWYALIGKLYGKDVKKNDEGYISAIIKFSGKTSNKKLGQRKINRKNNFSSRRNGKIKNNDIYMYITFGIDDDGGDYLKIYRK